jgi:hypothetical protein
MSEWGDCQSESVGLASFRLSPSRQVFAFASNIQQRLTCAAPSNRVALSWVRLLHTSKSVCVAQACNGCQVSYNGAVEDGNDDRCVAEIELAFPS